MFKHIDWCTCKTPNYGDPECNCPEVEELHRLVGEGMSKEQALKQIFKSDENKKPDEVVRRSGISIQL